MAIRVKELFTGKNIIFKKDASKDVASLTVSKIGFGNNGSLLRESSYNFEDKGDQIELTIDFTGTFIVEYFLEDSATTEAIGSAVAQSEEATVQIFAGGGGSTGSYTHPTYAPINYVNSGALIASVVTSDSTGHLISVTSRALTAAAIGAVTAGGTELIFGAWTFSAPPVFRGTDVIAPFSVFNSDGDPGVTPMVTSLNVQFLDGKLESAFEPADTAITKDDVAENIAGLWDFQNIIDFDTSITINTAPVTSVLIGNWNTAYGWGDHALASYIVNDGTAVNINVGAVWTFGGVQGNLVFNSTSSVAAFTVNNASGTPFMITDLNADLLDGSHASAFEPAITVLTVPKGGTGRATLTVGSALVGDGASNVALVPVSTTSVLSTIVKRDASKDVYANNFFFG